MRNRRRSPGFIRSVLLVVTLTAGCRADEPDASPASASPSDPLTEIAVVVGPESVAGWWDGEAWVRAENGPSEVPAKGGESYRLVRLADPLRTAEGSAAKEGCETIPGTAVIEIPGLERNYVATHEPPFLAVSRAHEPRPRKVEILNPEAHLYRSAAADLLRARNIDDPDADVVQVLRADLDGDGKDEVVVVAERLSDPQTLFAKSGDYSIVFLRRVVDEKPATTIVSESIPSFEPDATPYINSHRVSALADLNGDRRMEIAVSGRYYEGASINVYELKPDGSVPEVLNSGCGA